MVTLFLIIVGVCCSLDVEWISGADIEKYFGIQKNQFGLICIIVGLVRTELCRIGDFIEVAISRTVNHERDKG